MLNVYIYFQARYHYLSLDLSSSKELASEDQPLGKRVNRKLYEICSTLYLLCMTEHCLYLFTPSLAVLVVAIITWPGNQSLAGILKVY